MYACKLNGIDKTIQYEELIKVFVPNRDYKIVDDEYDFEDENEEYSMLSGILRLNNDRRKYFA